MKARIFLNTLESSSYPHMTPDGRSDLYDRVYKQAYPKNELSKTTNDKNVISNFLSR